MAKATQLVSLLGRLNPAIFDVIFPHGPVQALGFASRVNEVALNPQPLPPEPPPERLQRVSALIAHQIAFAAITLEASGQDGGVRMINSAVDDWCGNDPEFRFPKGGLVGPVSELGDRTIGTATRTQTCHRVDRWQMSSELSKTSSPRLMSFSACG